MKFIFGPIRSKRLGNSLGIDIVPFGTCTLDCIYCQVHKTRIKTITRNSFFELEQLNEELDLVLKKNDNLDYVTFSGSGEPTLNRDIGKIISMIKNKTNTPIAVITNGSLLHFDEVLEDLKEVDLIMPSLDAPSEDLFKRINRPHIDLDLKKLIRGLDLLGKSFTGNIFLEIMLLKEINDFEFCLSEFSKILSRLKFDKLFLNTVVRPPLETNICKSLTKGELKRITKYFKPLGIPIVVANPSKIQKRTMFAARDSKI